MARDGRGNEGTWVQDLAAWLRSTPADSLPPEVRRIASRQTLDTVACALGALDHDAARAMERVVQSMGGAAESSLVCQRTRTSALNAILYNGTLIRALDCNDAFLRKGLGGHPSDNIAVALAFAERQHSSGLEYLRAVALGYELYLRSRQRLYAHNRGNGYSWDGVSVSGLVAAAMAGLLLGLDQDRLTHALAIGGAQTYSLSEVRGGEISMLKASANAIAAHTGALGALLAAEGMTGPPQLFEGRRGMLAALGHEPDDELQETLMGRSDYWHIMDISIKPFPAIGTSQGALSATLELVREHKLRGDDVERVEVRFADLPVTRDHLADADRRYPRTRETADHSINFLIAAALQDGELGPAQFGDERWMRPDTRELMGRVELLADAELNAHAGSEYPAVVTVVTRGGKSLRREMLRVPGSPTNPLSDEALGQKLRRFAGSAFSTGHLEEIERRLLRLDQEPDMAEVGALLRG